MPDIVYQSLFKRIALCAQGESMITNVPLMVVPLIVYNLVLFGLLGTNIQSPWDDPIFRHGHDFRRYLDHDTW